MIACSTAGAISAPFDDAGTYPPLLQSCRCPNTAYAAQDWPTVWVPTSQALPAGAGAQAGGQQATSKLADIAASVKGFIFYTTTFLLALPLFAIMLLLSPFVLLFDKHRRLAQHFVNNIWAKVSTLLYYRVQVHTPLKNHLLLGTLLNQLGSKYLHAGCHECIILVYAMHYPVLWCRLRARRICQQRTHQLCMWQTTRASWYALAAADSLSFMLPLLKISESLCVSGSYGYPGNGCMPQMQSFMGDAVLQDIFTLFHLDRPFKFVSKTSNFFIPIVGWSMFLTGMTAHKTKYLLVMSPKSKQLDTM